MMTSKSSLSQVTTGVAPNWTWSNKDVAGCHTIVIVDDDEGQLKAVSSGANSLLMLTTGGSLYLGNNPAAELQEERPTLTKLNDTMSRGSPQSVQIQEVAAGPSHFIVLSTSHQVYTWGSNSAGQLGYRLPSRRIWDKPQIVKSMCNFSVIQVSCGSNHTLALTRDSLVFAWGSNSHGQLGNDSKLDTNDPIQITALTGLPVLQVTTGGYHSMALSTSGGVFGWGKNDCGQLGLNTKENLCLPKKINLFKDHKIAYISCGTNHTVCLSQDGRVFTCGSNDAGQLGCANDSCQGRQKLTMLPVSQVSQIACGSKHTVVYVPDSREIHIFGFQKGEQRVTQRRENVSNKMPPGQYQLTCESYDTGHFSVKFSRDNCWIKRISAGMGKLFVIVSNNPCQPDDFRQRQPEQRIAQLSTQNVSLLKISQPSDSTFKKILKDVETVFSSPSCLNNSFSLLNEEFSGCTKKRHGVDMNAVRDFFQYIKTNPILRKIVMCKITRYVLPALPEMYHNEEFLPLYLILPETHLFDYPEAGDSSLHCFARGFSALNENSLKILGSWWSTVDKSFFGRIVQNYVLCLEHLMWLSYKPSSLQENNRKQKIFIFMEMLLKLHRINEAHDLIPCSSFEVAAVTLDNIKHMQQTPVVVVVTGDYHVLESDEHIHLYSNYYFLFNEESRTKYFKINVTYQKLWRMRKEVRQSFQYLQYIDPFWQYYDHESFHLTVQRQNVYRDTISRLDIVDTDQLKTFFVAYFQDENSCGPGVNKEFFRLLFQEILLQENLLIKDEKSLLHWFNHATQEKSATFYQVGTLCGLMLYNQISADLRFPLALYKKLLGKHVTLDDFIELKPTEGSGLKTLLTFDGDSEEFDDLFSMPFVFGAIANENNTLFQDAENKMVTLHNRGVYVKMCVNHILNILVKEQFEAFSQGFHSICGGSVLNSLQPEELRVLLEGGEVNDFFKFEKNSKYETPYSEDHPTIILFWETFHKLTIENKRKFLVYLNGSDRISMSGMKELQMTIRPRSGAFLAVYTCSRILLLPEYTSKEQMESSLLGAVENYEGFCADNLLYRAMEDDENHPDNIEDGDNQSRGVEENDAHTNGIEENHDYTDGREEDYARTGGTEYHDIRTDGVEENKTHEIDTKENNTYTDGTKENFTHAGGTKEKDTDKYDTTENYTYSCGSETNDTQPYVLQEIDTETIDLEGDRNRGCTEDIPVCYPLVESLKTVHTHNNSIASQATPLQLLFLLVLFTLLIYNS